MPARTPFSNVSATGVVTNGVMQNDDFVADLPFMRLTGKGSVNLVSGVIDYALTGNVFDRPEGVGETTEGELGDLAKAVLPLTISGTLTAPKVGVDVAGLPAERLAEVRNAMLVARVKEGITGFSLSNDPNRKLMTAREALYLGTRGGAAVVGRNDIGSLEAGKCADFFAIDLHRIGFSGMHDPLAAVIFGQPVNADYTVVGGKFVVKEGQLCTVDEHKLIEKHNQAAKRLLS